jgi:hypothetical protein
VLALMFPMFALLTTPVTTTRTLPGLVGAGDEELPKFGKFDDHVRAE